MQPPAVISAAVVETRYGGHQSMSEADDNGSGGGGWDEQDRTGGGRTEHCDCCRLPYYRDHNLCRLYDIVRYYVCVQESSKFSFE